MKIDLRHRQANENAAGNDTPEVATDSAAVEVRGLSRRDAMRYLTSAGVAGLTATVLAGCGGGGSSSSALATGTTTKAATLTITPASTTIAVGATTILTVTAVDSNGNSIALVASNLTYTSLTPAIATVSSTGVVTAVSTGTAQIQVTDSASGKSTTVTLTVSTTATTAHAVTPEGEIGPYFTNDSATGYNRSNILSNIDGTQIQTGIPLTLKVYVYDTENGNAPMSGCQIDIWHCNAYGVYSNESVESTLGQSWLRGYQTTDANGYVTFTSIVPGWYQGRTTHIHLRVRSKYSEASSTSDGTNTTQVFFPQATVNYLATNVAPYKSEGINNTTNVGDHVYTGETHAEMEMVLTGDYNSGYTATVAIYLPITSE